MADATRCIDFLPGAICSRAEGLLGLTIIGRTLERPAEQASLALAATAPVDLPASLQAAAVVRLQLGRCKIHSGSRDWEIPVRSWHLHFEVTSVFYRSIEPRQPPWSKRLFWRLVLALAAHPLGRRLLLQLRKH